MTFEVGPLHLDESARILRLDGRSVALQPRVFDLLVYLVRNRARVVPKDELLDAIWPGVLVTDNSLQRAISLLRGEFRAAGMDEAIRNFPRNGYRFCAEAEAAPAAADPASTLARARRAVDEQRWTEADTLFGTADATPGLSGADLDLWALTLQCLGQPGSAIPVLRRAIAAHSELADANAAALSATVLSAIHLERGELSVAKGWISRASELLEPMPDAPAGGRVLWMKARLTASEGQPQAAVEFAEQAYEFGRRSDDYQTTALGLMYRGFYRLSLGMTQEGLADQDHAATLALSQKLDPVTGGVLYCNVLWACRTFGDWARANQWTLSYQQFCTVSQTQITGSCQLHRAEVLGVQGTLDDALVHVRDAMDKLTHDAPWARGDAYRVLGDIHAAIGDDEAALAAYQRSYELGWCPEPGHAMLLVERGDVQGGLACLERSLVGQTWWTLQRQGMLLAHLAVVAAAAAQQDRAEALIADLAGQANRWPMPSVRALTSEASALLALSRDDRRGALQHLHLARQLWTSIDGRLHAARLRMLIADCLLAIGDRAGAQAEISAALTTAHALRSRKLEARCAQVQARLSRDEA